MYRIEQFDKCQDKCLSVSMNYCNVGYHYRCNSGYLLRWIENQKSTFLLNSRLDNLNGYGIKCGFASKPYDCNINTSGVIGTMIQNNIGISKLFKHRVLNRFEKLYKNKQFVHRYHNEGLEIDEFKNGCENVKNLIDDCNNAQCDTIVDEKENDKDALIKFRSNPSSGSNPNMASVTSIRSVSASITTARPRPKATPNPVLRANITSVRWSPSWTSKKD